MTDVKLFALLSNMRNHFTVFKQSIVNKIIRVKIIETI